MVTGVNGVLLLTPLVQVYVAAPEPESTTGVFKHTVWFGPAETFGSALTTTVTVS